MSGRPYTPIADRARFHIDENGCYIWGGTYGAGGYGLVAYHGRTVNAHRAAWIDLVGPIEDHLQVDHLCRNKACINPDHLEPVTHAENQRRRALAQTHCKRGHEFTEANTYVTSKAFRQCRTCVRIREQQYRARRAA